MSGMVSFGTMQLKRRAVGAPGPAKNLKCFLAWGICCETRREECLIVPFFGAGTARVECRRLTAGGIELAVVRFADSTVASRVPPSHDRSDDHNRVFDCLSTVLLWESQFNVKSRWLMALTLIDGRRMTRARAASRVHRTGSLGFDAPAQAGRCRRSTAQSARRGAGGGRFDRPATGSIAYARAAGRRAVGAQAGPMTRDTVFDMASLTKPIATRDVG